MPVYRCYECSNVLCNDCCINHDKLTNTECHTFQSTNDTMLLNKKFKVCDVSQVVDMRTLPGGLLVLALFDHRMLVTYSVSDKQQHQISVSGRPCSIAILDRNTVVVLLQRDFGIIESMEIVDVRQRQVIYHENMTFNLTCGLFCPVLFIDDQLYISSLSGIIVTNMSGTVDRKIQLGFIPRDMCYDTKAARIYCIEVSKKKLSCIDRDGNLLFAFTDSSLTNLKHLTLDNEGYVLILCCQGYDDNKVRNFKVHRMKPDGKSSEAIITWKQNITHRNSLSSITFQEESNQVVIRKENTVYIYGKQ